MAEPVKNWTPSTWRSRPIKQVPEYPDAAALANVEARLKAYPPLVFAGEARNLMASLGQVAHVGALAYSDALGVKHVLVNGKEILRDDKFQNVLPGKVLRSGRDTYTVTP